MMADKAYFCFLLEWADMFGLLMEEQSGKLIKAMIAYEKDGVEPDFSSDNLLAFAWLSNVKPKMDKLKEHYDGKRKQTSEAGKASAEARRRNKLEEKNIFEQASTDVESVERNKRTLTDVDNIDLDLDIDLVNKKEKVKKEKSDSETGFDVFWKNYPRHDSKTKARESFLKALKKGVTLDVLIAAIGKQKQCRQWQENGGQYIPYASTWLNQERWEDEVTVSSMGKVIPIRKNDAQEGFKRALAMQGLGDVNDG